MPTLRTRTAALAAVALLAAGCSTVTDVKNTADAARNTVEVCAEAAPKIVSAMSSAAAAVARYRPQNAAQVEQQVTTTLEGLHNDLQQLAQKAEKADLKAALERMDTEVNRWAADPAAFIDGGTKQLTDLNTDLQKACSGV
jgi:hypothetical protein